MSTHTRFCSLSNISKEELGVPAIHGRMVDLVIETIKESQSNLEEKYNPSILTHDFLSSTDPSIVTLIAP